MDAIPRKFKYTVVDTSFISIRIY